MKLVNYRIILLLLFICSFSISTRAQAVKYLGKVINSETKKPIANAQVIIKGTSEVTFTNILGYFEVSTSNQELIISHIGYETIETGLNPGSLKFLIAIPPVRYSLQDLKLVDSIGLDVFNYDQEYFDKEINRRSMDQESLEIAAEFPDGLKSFHNYLTNGLLDLKDSIDSIIDTEVYFTVMTDGSVRVDSIQDIPSLENMFANSPKWIPAFQQHVTTMTSFKQKIQFDPKVEIWSLVEILPEYPGGMMAFYKFVGDNMTYPKEARRAGITGRVHVSYIINKLGELEEVKALNKLGYGLEEEAVRCVMLSSGKWIPGSQKGQPVRVRMAIPIIFKLSN